MLNLLANKVIYEGKAKTLYKTSDPETLIQFFKDDATANNAKKHTVIKSKEILNNLISEFLMLELENKGIQTHFIKRISDREQLIKRVKIIPVELVVRNKAYGSIIKRYDVKENKKFSSPLIEFFYKKDELELLIRRRESLKPLKETKISKSITGRDYQQRAIRCITESFELKKRKALLVMATGTGKTLGYLMPAALFSLEDKSPVLIATGTKALQTQATLTTIL